MRYIVETNSADGLILNQIEPEDSRVSKLIECGFPFATYGRSNWCAEHPYFDFDNASFGEVAATSLFRRGRRNLLLVAPPLEYSYATHMIGQINNALAQTGESL